MKILHAPQAILSKKCIEVTFFDDKLANLIQKMNNTLRIQHDPDCVGLAANQVGVDLSLFIMRPSPTDPITTHINPKIKKIVELPPPKKNQKEKSKFEGCMSLPHIWGEMKRSNKVLLQFQDLKGNWHENWYTDFSAQIVQHEVDHLNGILFTQRVLEQGGNLFEERGDELVAIPLI